MRSRVGGAARNAAVIVLVSLTSLAGAALAATGRYSGKTSQRQTVSFRISSGAVHNFRLVVLDKCPDGHVLGVTATYPTMRIASRKFGGTFAPVRGHAGERAVLSGTVGRRSVTGKVHDTSYSPRERALCHGSATFTARHA